MKVSEICRRHPVTVRRDDTIQTAAMLMRERHVEVLVVVEGDDERAVPVGVLTDHDIVVSLVARNVPNMLTLEVGDVLTHGVIIARLDESLNEALRRASSSGVRRLPVVDDDGRLVGLLALSDLLAVLSDQLGQVARLARLDGHHTTIG